MSRENGLITYLFISKSKFLIFDLFWQMSR